MSLFVSGSVCMQLFAFLSVVGWPCLPVPTVSFCLLLSLVGWPRLHLSVVLVASFLYVVYVKASGYDAFLFVPFCLHL